MKHFIHGGPFALCACNFKEDVSHIGVPCLRCGQRAIGPFIIRRGKQIFTGGEAVKVKVINPVRVSSAFDRTYPDGSQFVHVKDAKGRCYMGDVKVGQALADADWTPTYPLSGKVQP